MLQSDVGLVVEKGKIAGNGEYNLSGERYRENNPQLTNYPYQAIGSLVETITPPAKIPKTDFGETGRYPIIDQSQKEIAGWTNDERMIIHPSKPLVIFGDHTCIVKLASTPFAQGADGIKILQTTDNAYPQFLYHILRVKPLENDGYRRHFSKLKEYEIPLPPLEVQREIVAEIEGYQKVLDGARMVVDNYRPHIHIDPEWPLVRIGDVFQKSRETVLPESLPGPITYISLQNIAQDNGQLTGNLVADNPAEIKSLKNVFQPGDILYGKLRPNLNKVWQADRNGICSTDIFVIRPLDGRVVPDLYAYIFQSGHFNHAVLRQLKGAQLPRVGWQSFANLQIPLPPLDVQVSITAEIEAEQAIVSANRELVERFERKIQAVVGRVWGG